MHHIACAFAFSALIAGQFWAVLITRMKVGPSGGRPSSRSRAARQTKHGSRLAQTGAEAGIMCQGGTRAAVALLGGAGSIVGIG